MAAIFLGAKGPCCRHGVGVRSSAHAIGESVEMIRRGVVDVVYAGGAEAPVTRLSVAGFGAMGALSTRNDEPAAGESAVRRRS